MRKMIIFCMSLVLAACSQTPWQRAEEECKIALHGVENTGVVTYGPLTKACMKRIQESEKVTRENILDEYRAMSRLPENQNADANRDETRPESEDSQE